MALSDKNIVITPNIGATNDPKIVFSGSDASTAAQNITLTAYPTNSGTLSFDGSAGQLFSITNSLSGSIFSVNDVSGIPSIEVLDTGIIKLGQYSGNILLGTATDNGTDKLQVTGSITATKITSTVATGTAPFTVASTTPVANLSIGGNAATVTNGVYTTTAQTLTNKSLSDSTTYFIDETDDTKKLQFQLSSITTATTRTLTVPNVNGTIITTGDTGTVTSTMIAEGTIVNGDISASAAIAITKLASSTISGISLGSNLNALTISSPLSGTSYNGSAAVSIGLANTAVTAGSYTNTNLTVDAQGRITAASSGTAGGVTSVTGTAPVVSSGGTTPAISMAAATTSVPGYLTAADWTTFNGKYSTGGALGTPSSGTLTNCTFPTLNQNTTGTASNITAYTINQNVGTANAVQFSDITTKRAAALTTGYIYYGNTGTKYAGFDGTNFVTSMPMSFNILGSSASCTGNAATATASQNATFLTQPNATWGAKIQLGGNGGGSGVANIATVQATDGNIHIDGGVGKSMYLNYYNNGTIYLNGGTYQISSNGSQYNGNAATATTASNANALGNVALTNIPSGNNAAAASDLISDMNNFAGQKSGFYIYNNPTNAPTATWNTWMTAMGHYAGDRYGYQLSHGYWDNDLWVRGFNSNTARVWRKVLDSGNYNSYAPSLTGGGASGTWGISVTGTATNASYLNGTAQTSLFIGKVCSTVDINGANDTGSISVRGDATYPASMSFHRAGAYAINVGLSNANNFVIGGWSASSNAFSMTGVGALTMLNNITAYSDERLKKNWRDLPVNFVERLADVKHGIYDRTDQECTQVGVSAQSLQPLLPDAIMTQVDGMLSVSYGNAALVSAVQLAKEVVLLKEQSSMQSNTIELLIEAIKEQQVQIDELKQIINKGK